jgi:hypothetical protein
VVDSPAIVSLFWSKKIGSLDLLPILLVYDFKSDVFYKNHFGLRVQQIKSNAGKCVNAN